MEQFMSIGDLISYLEELPPNIKLSTHLIEDNTFTVLVDSKGEARTLRNAQNDYRWLIIDLPGRQ